MTFFFLRSSEFQHHFIRLVNLISSGTTVCLCRTEEWILPSGLLSDEESGHTLPYVKQKSWEIFCEAFVISKGKNRGIRVLFGVCIHDSALFVWRISIIKYCIKHSCHISASLVPAACLCYFFYWDTVIAPQFIGGHQSLASLCKRLSTALSVSTSGRIWDLFHRENCGEMSHCRIHLQFQSLSFLFFPIPSMKSSSLHQMRRNGSWKRRKTVISVPSAKREVNLKSYRRLKCRIHFFISAQNDQLTAFSTHTPDVLWNTQPNRSSLYR